MTESVLNDRTCWIAGIAWPGAVAHVVMFALGRSEFAALGLWLAMVFVPVYAAWRARRWTSRDWSFAKWFFWLSLWLSPVSWFVAII